MRSVKCEVKSVKWREHLSLHSGTEGGARRASGTSENKVRLERVAP